MSLYSLSIASQGYSQEVIKAMDASGDHMATANIACDGYLRTAIVPAVPRTIIVPRRKKLIIEEDEVDLSKYYTAVGT